MQNTLRRFISQTLFEAYSVGLINSLKKKFKAEEPTLTDQQIEYYIDIFDRQKNSAPVRAAKGPDITKYSWAELETLIDANFSTRSLHEPQIQGDLEPIYKSPDETLQIFLGDRREKCIKIRQDFEKRTNKQYSWCISRSDASNAFSTYRFRHDEPVFYYLFDLERDKSDPLHACVIYVTAQGKYLLSDELNDGDKQKSWKQLTTMMPKIKNLKPLLKHIPLSDKEKEIYKKVGDRLSDEDFAKLSRDLKEEYIGFGHKLTDSQIRNIAALPGGLELINKYVNMHQNVFLPLEIYRKLPNATKVIIKKNFEAEKLESFEFWYEGKQDFEGDLNLVGAPVTSLPAGLKVGGDLVLSHTTITSLPNGLNVGGNLNLSITSIASLPAGLKVGGDLDLSHTPITSLPSDLKVGGDFRLSRSSITSLPANLIFNGSLRLAYAPITSLPDGLKVGGDLILSSTPITSLPDGLKVGGDLILSSTPITSLPVGLEVGGGLNLGYTLIASLPAGLNINNYLFLDGIPITTLPAGLKVGGDLELSHTTITSLPVDLIVKGTIFPAKLQKMYNKMKAKKNETVLREFIRSVLA